MEQVEGRVIRILDDKNIVINLGANDNLMEGDAIDIIVRGDEVVDNDKSLGTMNYVKEHLEITHLENQFSVVSKVTEHVVPTSTYSNLLKQMSESINSTFGSEKDIPHRTYRQKDKFRVNRDEINPFSVPEDAEKPISLGDIAVSSLQ